MAAEPKMVSIEAHLRRTLADITPVPIEPEELEVLWGRLHRSWVRHRSFEGLSSRDLRRVPWILFYPAELDQYWFSKDSEFFDAYRIWLLAGSRASAVSALVGVLLRDWPSDREALNRWLQLAREALTQSRSRRLTVWRERCAEFGHLEMEGPRNFAQRFRESADKGAEFLAAAGLDGTIGFGRFVEAACNELMVALYGELDQGMVSETELKRLLSLLESPDDRSLRSPRLLSQIAESVLLPFEQETPEAAIREAIQEFLLAHLGDPRFRSSDWQGVNPRARQVMLRWLVAMTLEDFFQILDRTAMDRMWSQRREFWTAYLKKGVITDAWLVLGSHARRLARRELKGQKGWGILGGQADSTQSVLIMKLAGLTIAEWSHNGKCCFWLADNPKAPALYRSSRYEAYRLRDRYGADEGVIHDPYGRWIRGIERYIQGQTGVQRRA